MTARNPDVRRAIVTWVSDEGDAARVLIEWMRLNRNRDRAAIQEEPEEDTRGLLAETVPGVQVGDEVLVDLRPMPIVWLSFLFFMVPILLVVLAAVVLGTLGDALGLPPAATLGVQLLGCVAGVYAGYRLASLELDNQKASGRGTPVVTAIMPRFVEQAEGSDDPRDAYLQSVFPLRGAPDPGEWEFCREELMRVVGVRSAELEGDRVEVVFHGRQLKEKHVLELLTMFNIPVELDREIAD